ncbi:MAG TPA: FHA domain-containing protein [Candidatus Polarisedimenticolia bacterium]|nr:FHA domain-containing protein [Candidatus Polarisedimenticolia bacterium]
MHTTNDSGEVIRKTRRSTGAWLIRKEKPLNPPNPPKRPPAPGGINAPGGSVGGGMICPGTDPSRRPAAAAADGSGAIDETALDSPAQRFLRKPSALGGKSIYLTVIEGDLKGQSFDVTGIGTYTIGRKECDIVLDDEKVSRKHASIVIIRENQYAVQDLASRNGTFVNGIRLTRRNLQHNDLIRIGNTTLRFTVFDGPVPVQK